ncbi:MAG: hypothetical protein AAGA35_04230 [Patescibacteria group bacterium]
MNTFDQVMESWEAGNGIPRDLSRCLLEEVHDHVTDPNLKAALDAAIADTPTQINA